MSKSSDAKTRDKSSAARKQAPPDESTTQQRPMKDGIRETVESVVIAFVLAFLFRTFEAEAFVIPTGSMATTLRGQHKDLRCSNCKFRFLVSASEEEPNENDNLRNKKELADFQYEHAVVRCVCPNCGFEMNFGDDAERPPASFKGDRILVGKFAYEFGDPKRWDVAVFHYPHGAHQNYIKRLVGLPGETIVIYRGDLMTTAKEFRSLLSAQDVERLLRDGNEERAATLTLERKGADKVQAMLQVVYDNNFAHREAPRRWRPAGDSGASWQVSDDGRAFETQGDAAHEVALMYQHRMPAPAFWDPQAGQGPRLNPDFAPPQLITDGYGYNMGTTRSAARDIDDERRPYHGGPDFGECWVSDLALDCHVQITGGDGELVMQLVESNCLFECRLDVATGKAQFTSTAPAMAPLEVETAVRGPGEYRLQFANVDDQLLLWVNGNPVAFDGRFAPLENRRPGPEDLSPVRFGSRGAAVRVDRLRVLRDVYYRSVRSNAQEIAFDDRDVFVDPHLWSQFEHAPPIQFRLGPEQFLMLGDNSPRSSDSRFWRPPEFYVKRDLLIGKALYIYWPHALDHLPGTEIWFPFFPDFGRMRLVR